MKKRLIPLLGALLILTAGCGGGARDAVSTDGSTSMAVVMAALGEAYREKHPGVVVNYSGTGSGAGVEAVRVLTTSTTLEGTANRSFSPINSILIIDYVMRALRRSLAALLRGAKNSPSTLSAVSSQLTVLLGDFLERGIIAGYEAPRVSCPPETPEVCVAQVSFRAAYLINQIHIRAQIQL